MIVDPTTKNFIYNSTSPQGQWYKHRWGRRNYPIVDLPLFYPATEHITLSSVYGDPLAWTHINEFCKNYKGNISIITYGVGVLPEHDNITYILKLDGIHELCGKVFLGAEWNESILARVDIIEFHQYAHNKRQLLDVYQLCVEHNLHLVIVDGAMVDYYGASIIDQECNWLYDVFPATHDSTELVRTVEAYNSLRTYVKPPQGRSILRKPMIAKQPEIYRTVENDGEYIAPTGHKFTNRNMFTMFMLMLGDDWVATNPQNEYEEDIIFYARQLTMTVSDPVVT